jgi:putative transposase
MKFLGIKSIIIKKYNHAGKSNTDYTKEYPNFLKQDFYANIPSQKWGGDITYIYTKETGWTYLAIVMDLFDLKVVGWSYGLSMTESLVIEALNEAKLAILEFIESWYNNQIIHSSIGYITPNQKYNNYIANLAIA